jgi:ATP-dependent RNA helicase DHX34
MEKHSRNRSRSSSRDRKRRHKDRCSSEPQITKRKESDVAVTNLVDFTFLDFKHDLNRILLGYSYRDQLIDNVDDFWLFLNKYENLLRRSGQCILPVPLDLPPFDDITIPKYDKLYNSSLKLAVPFDSVYSRLSYDHARELTPVRVQQFLQIVVHYLDFKQKEKFNRLKKLRRSQANLPVAQYRDQIIEAIRNEQVVILAGDTGCGKSTQIPQYMFQAGFEGIGELEATD